MIAYDKQTYNAPNPLARLAHRARYGAADRLVRKYLRSAEAAMLDFGCGDGRMLERVRLFAPLAELVGYEPLMEEGAGLHTQYKRVSTEADVRHGQYDLITAFEVLEHLEPQEIDGFVTLARETLREGGVLIVSVPIMLGPVLIPKLINAQYVRKSTWRYSLSEMIGAAFFLKPVPRFRGTGYLTHKGFDWRMLRDRLSQDFELREEEFSPFPVLPWGLNSQWFGVFRPLPRSVA